MIVANLASPVQPLAGAGERKPRNYNAATLEFISAGSRRVLPSPPPRNLFSLSFFPTFFFLPFS